MYNLADILANILQKKPQHKTILYYFEIYGNVFFSDDTQGRNRLLVIGKIVVGDFLDQMNWQDIRDRIVG